MAARVHAKVNSVHEADYHHHMTAAAAVVNSAYEADHHHHMTAAAAADLEKSSDHSMTSHFEHPILINPESSPEFLHGMDRDSDENSRDCTFCADTGVPEAVTIIIIGVEDEITTEHVDHHESSSASEKGCIIINSGNSPAVGVQTITETYDAATAPKQMKATTTLQDQKADLFPKVTGHDQKGTVCRICQLESDRAFSLPAPSAPTNLILLGCGCKGELATVHSPCAEAWFTVRGNRLCEICGEIAENVTGLARDRFMEEWNEGGSPAYDSNTADRGRGSWTGQPWCNLLLACLVIAFVLPWFLRIDLF